LERVFLLAGAASGFVAVALGAFAAHGLKARLSGDLLAIFETGVRYQMFHALALLGAMPRARGWLVRGWVALSLVRRLLR